MINAAHLLETAVLLLAAFLIGACVGLTLRLLSVALSPKRRPQAEAMVTAQVAAVAGETALVTGPVIAPVTRSDPPVAPDVVPIPDFAPALTAMDLSKDAPAQEATENSEARPTEVPATAEIAPMPAIMRMPSIIPLARPSIPVEPPVPTQMFPARIAGQTTHGVQVPLPAPVAATEPVVPKATAEVIAFPAPVNLPPVQAFELEDEEGIIRSETPSKPPESLPPHGAEPEPDTELNIEPEQVAAGEQEPPLSTPIESPASPVLETQRVQPDAAELPPADAVTVSTPPAVPDEEDFLFVDLDADLAPPQAAELTQPPPSDPAPAVAASPSSGDSDMVPGPEEDGAPQAGPADPPGIPAPEPVWEPAIVARPTAEGEPPSAPADMESAAPEPVAPPSPRSATEEMDEEAAAMRAIEGGWSPRRTVRPTRPADRPEGIDEATQAVAEAAAAVAAAARAVNVIAEGIPSGRPAGIGAPRGGRKDDLTRIAGIPSIVEMALNNLGIFHFDQVANLSDDNIRWIENHIAIPGRVAREKWRDQARAHVDETPLRDAASG